MCKMQMTLKFTISLESSKKGLFVQLMASHQRETQKLN